jgi:uncharacterized ParB-like nuclease family protein
VKANGLVFSNALKGRSDSAWETPKVPKRRQTAKFTQNTPYLQPLTRSISGHFSHRLRKTPARTRFLQLVAPLPRQAAAGIHAPIGNHTFRVTGITAYLANGGALEHAQDMAAHESPRTTKPYGRAPKTGIRTMLGSSLRLLLSLKYRGTEMFSTISEPLSAYP